MVFRNQNPRPLFTMVGDFDYAFMEKRYNTALC